jgi:PAS domain-containing protein
LAAGPSDAGPTAHAELLQERLLLRTLIDNLPDAIYVKDATCRKTIVPVE